MEGAVFDDLIARLPDYQCFAPDLPGHGVAGDQTPSLDCATVCVQRLIRDRNLQNVVLIGWSMGAAVAWRYMRLFHGANIVGLMSIDMSPKMTNDGDWALGLLGQNRESLLKGVARFEQHWDDISGAVKAGMFAKDQPADPATLAQAHARIQRVDPAPMEALWRDLIDMDERATMAEIQCPFQVAYGVRSKLYPAETAEWIAAQAPNATPVPYETSGHSPHLEQPEEFAQRLRSFLREIETSSGLAYPA